MRSRKRDGPLRLRARDRPSNFPPSLRARLRYLYHGTQPAAVKFRLMVIVVDLIIIGFFLATPILVSLMNRKASVKKHNAAVAAARSDVPALVDAAPVGTEAAAGTDGERHDGGVVKRGIVSPRAGEPPSSGTWRPGRR